MRSNCGIVHKINAIIILFLVGLIVIAGGCNRRHGVLAPVITSITPSGGNVGDTITITGKNFGKTASKITVKFNGIASVVKSATSKQITVTVPEGASSGKITVTINGLSATSSSDFIVGSSPTSPSPTITGFTTGGQAGDTVTITGTNFSTTPAANTVKFNGVTAGVMSSTATQIVVAVPEGATTGPISVTAGGLTATSSSSFTVAGAPTISGFTPTGQAGSTVTITGTNFSTAAGSNTVKFNGIAAVITSCTSTQIVVTVPAGATTGKITVTVNGNTAASATDFTVASASANEFAYMLTVDEQYIVDHYEQYYKLATFAVNPVTGAFTSSGDLLEITEPYNIAIHPNGKFAYTADHGSTISIYYINSSGQIAQVGDSISGVPYATCMAIDPSGKFLYVGCDNDNYIWIYQINADTGALTYLSKGGYVGYDSPYSITIDPSGKFLYAAHHYSDKIYIYQINSSTGALTSAGDVDIDSGPLRVNIDPSGKFLYVSATDTDKIFAFTINQTTGALTAAGTPAATGDGPEYIAIDPSGKFLYAPGFGADNVSAFAINQTTGALSAIGTPAATGDGPWFAEIDPSGKFLYVINNYDDTISVFMINQTTGALTPATTITPDLPPGEFVMSSFVPGPPPTITDFTSSGAEGETVTIKGTNFSTIPADNIVEFNGVAAIVLSSTTTELVVAVPDGATTGKITVTVGGNTAISSTDFMVIPPITSPVFAGYYDPPSSDIIPCYWIGDERITLDLTDAVAGEALSPVAVVGSTIYVLGETYDTDGLCYWVATASGSTRYEIPKPAGAYNYNVVGIVVLNGTVYIAGNYSYYDDQSLNKDVVCLWTNGGSAVPISDLTGHSWARAITVSGGKVYIAGRYLDTATSTYKACYWEGTERKDLPQPVYLTATTSDIQTTAITVSDDGHVYVAGNFKTKDNISFTAWKACYWKDTDTYTILDGAPKGDYGYGHYTSAIALEGGDIYVAGLYSTNNGGDGACYWKNGTYTKLSSTGYPYTSAMTIIDGTPYFGGGYFNSNGWFIASLWNGETTVRTDLEDATYNSYIPSSMDYPDVVN